MENAPLLAEAIAEYTGKSKGELKELSSEGLITADIIKNAMFASADQINARYNKMPMTWAQIWTRIKNVAIKALDPVLVKINELANNQQVQEMFNMFINGASLAAQAILALIEGISWLVSVLEPVAPVILGIVAAYVAFNIISGIVSGVLAIMSLVQGIQAAASMMQANAAYHETCKQAGDYERKRNLLIAKGLRRGAGTEAYRAAVQCLTEVLRCKLDPNRIEVRMEGTSLNVYFYLANCCGAEHGHLVIDQNGDFSYLRYPGGLRGRLNYASTSLKRRGGLPNAVGQAAHAAAVNICSAMSMSRSLQPA